MELKIDLLKIEKKSVFRIIVGILLLITSILMIFIKLKGNPQVSWWDWLFAFVLSLSGITSILGGAGFASARILGKSFIDINENSISIKSGQFEKEQKIVWNNIKSMDYMANKYRVTLKDSTLEILSLSKLEYLHKQEVKSIIEEIAAEKGVLIS